MSIDQKSVFNFSIAKMGRMMRAREISSREITQAFLERIKELNDRTRAFTVILADEALAQADNLDTELNAGLDRGPLHGVPIGLKDLIDTAGIVTAAGMAIHADRIPSRDATIAHRLKQAGAVFLGKLALTEGATLHHHPAIPAPLNPWDASRSSGFSSSGSGVAIAARLCAGALGSDTGGSIRIPSAFNGITGLKPTWGRVSRCGVFPLNQALDTIGPMAGSAADAAAILTVIAGADIYDPTAAHVPVPDYLGELQKSIAGVAIGVDWRHIESCASPGVVNAVRHVAAILEARGARLREIKLPSLDLAPLFPLMFSGTAASHRDTYPARANEYGPDLAGLLDQSSTISAADVGASIDAANILKGHMAQTFSQIDLLLIPAVLDVAPCVEPPLDLNSALGDFTYTLPFNVTGSPTVTVPAGFVNGMPVAAQLVGRHFDEALLLRGAHAFQSATDWHTRRALFS